MPLKGLAHGRVEAVPRRAASRREIRRGRGRSHDGAKLPDRLLSDNCFREGSARGAGAGFNVSLHGSSLSTRQQSLGTFRRAPHTPLVAVLALAISAPAAPAAEPVINELQPANRSTILARRRRLRLDRARSTLGTRPWTLPAGSSATIRRIWRSGCSHRRLCQRAPTSSSSPPVKTERSSTGELHTSFKLDAWREYLLAARLAVFFR
jgi:hypothetical protein